MQYTDDELEMLISYASINRPTQAVIDLGALRQNIRELRALLRPDCKFMAIVKANAYGHGMLAVAKAAIQAGAEYLGVAIAEEGIALSNHGIRVPILVLGAPMPYIMEEAIACDLRQSVFSVKDCNALQDVAKRLGRRCKVHIKIDTGMNRIGVRTVDDLVRLINCLKDCPNIEIEGMFTHFAQSDDLDSSYTEWQYERFMEFVRIARNMDVSPMLHCCNSGAILKHADRMQLDLVRAGTAMYGYSPALGYGIDSALKPVLSWKTMVVNVKQLAVGESVSYGRRYTAKVPSVIATLPVGYGDGYRRCMSGKAQVLIHGKRVPVVGAICMDQCMVDVTGLTGVCRGDEAILIGCQGEDTINADEMAEWAGTISYEILLSISARVPRKYIDASDGISLDMGSG